MSTPCTVRPGTKVEAALNHIRAEHPRKLLAAELAEAISVDAKNVPNLLDTAIQAGLIVVEKSGRKNLFSLGSEGGASPIEPGATTGDLTALARQAVAALKGTLLSSHGLAAVCNTTAEQIDAALAPLHQAGKLIRVDVMRGGVRMFDYRYSATWVPRDADFDQQATAGQAAPTPQVSPVAPPKPKTAPSNPASPWRNNDLRLNGSSTRPPPDALATGAELGKKAAAPATAPVPAPAPAPAAAPAERIPVFTSPENLGWKLSTPPAVEPAVREAIAASLETAPSVLEANDLVCAINSRGELVLDLGDEDIVRFPPAQALYLKRFLDNTSVLEELAAQGLI
jgi:DNA-binding transcriptional ArsR family regulator